MQAHNENSENLAMLIDTVYNIDELQLKQSIQYSRKLTVL
jgi:hypothetical protein